MVGEKLIFSSGFSSTFQEFSMVFQEFSKGLFFESIFMEVDVMKKPAFFCRLRLSGDFDLPRWPII